MFNFTKNLPYFFVLPALLVILALAALGVWGLKAGIDLAGGSQLQVAFPDGAPTVAQIQSALAPLNLGPVQIQPAGTDGYLLSQRSLTNDEKDALEAAISQNRVMTEVQYTSIGPSIGQETLDKGLLALLLVVVCIIAFIAFAFRKVSEPVASWKYGVIAVIALLFDVLIPVGVFSALGHFTGAEVDSLFIVALLSILGISINDKIVVFDRVRENLGLGRREPFALTVEKSIRQTLARSINTSMTVVIVLLSLYFLGPATTQTFALTLAVGMVIGTYSSIFLASPLLVAWERFQNKK
jgi:preprotein translocase subunit SecF